MHVQAKFLAACPEIVCRLHGDGQGAGAKSACQGSTKQVDMGGLEELLQALSRAGPPRHISLGPLPKGDASPNDPMMANSSGDERSLVAKAVVRGRGLASHFSIS